MEASEECWLGGCGQREGLGVLNGSIHVCKCCDVSMSRTSLTQ